MTDGTDHVYCPACGTQIPAGASFCRACGHQLPPRAEPATTPVEAPAPEAPAPGSKPGFVTFMGESVSRPPVSPPAAEQAPPTSPPPPAPHVPAATAAPQAAPPPPATPVAPKPPAAPPPSPPIFPAGERWSTGRIVAIVVTVLLLGGGIAAALLLGGDSGEKQAAATPTAARAAAVEEPQATPEPTAPAATPDALEDQVATLDELLKLSHEGREAAIQGDFDAAAGNRSKLLRDLRSLRAEATDAQMRAATAAFIAAIREALRQNRECTDTCTSSDLERVGQLKQDALKKINPLLRQHDLDSYKSSDI